MKSAEAARQSRLYDVSITAGLIAYGVVHLLVAWIALQLAWGRPSEEASEEGALRQLADEPLGGVLLWVVAIGLFVLVIWRILDLVYGHLDLEKKLSAVGRGLVYLTLGISAIRVAVGSGGSSTGSTRSLSARLMENGAGRVLIVVVGLVIIAIGVRQLYKAATKKFTEDLTGGVSDTTVLLGRIGYAAKGIAFFIVGALFGWAAIDYDPQKAGGLDTALHTIKEQPFGAILLTLMAIGIACFGVYCFAWSRSQALSSTGSQRKISYGLGAQIGNKDA
ncbi:uncharacterized protein DUF1206 [Kribbella sp. VKM Ac-2527]|uniref:Uncharacterized protein DUF1206 n=1 Tax=Kribbella caucasensis TaxID=2512215 RepID=A0A4R6KLT1_9ACTN|nr:DUF1206 domain-containing protein [Kribbella sp. VKM Ac-2527]TDO51345.1 uncharacterized protein DUF1206 [Kribbella sp. VKM Ac-2527]